MSKASTIMKRALLRLNNGLTRLRRVRTSPEHVLLLVAHCLQRGDCGRQLTGAAGTEGGNGGCVRCGRCQIDKLMSLRERTGVKIHVAGGGRQALAQVRSEGVRAVVAVACEKELLQGIIGVFPAPVMAVCNTRPLGDCHDTLTDLAAVESAISEFTTYGATAEKAV